MNNLNSKLWIKINLLILLISFSGVANAHFGSKGPFGGSVTCAIATSTTVYLGTLNGGVFESTNSSLVAWRARPVGLKSGKITALEHTGSYLFAGTADSGVYIFNGYVGSDRHWIKINNGLSDLRITSLVAIDSISVMAGTFNGGIFLTTDKGATWVDVNNNVLHHYNITGLVNAGNRIIHTSDGGVWASDDTGVSWIDYNDVNTYHIEAYKINYNSATDEILVVNSDGLFISSNASTASVPVYTLAQSGLPAGIVINSISNNGTTWFLATDQGVFSSAVGSINWIAENSGLSTLNVKAVVPFQTEIVAGTYSKGVFKSSLASISWMPNNTSFNNSITYSMATYGDSVIIAATEDGVFRSVNLATTYFSANTGLTDSLNVNDLIYSGVTLYAATQNAGVFVSVNNGISWSAFNTGLSNLNIKKLFSNGSTLILLNNSNELFMYTGFNWVSIQTGLPGGVQPTSIAFYDAKILLGTNGDGIFTKPIIGGTWTQENTGLSNLNVTAVTASSDKIFAGTDGSGVFVSDMNAISWNATSATSISHTTLIGLDGTKIQAMAYNMGYVFASYKGGLLATSDNGNTWIAGGNQFNLPSYTDVDKISFVTSRVFVTTENNSLYSNSLSELPPLSNSTDDISELQNLIKIYPNPSNGMFKLLLENNQIEISSVEIVDLSGKTIEHFNQNNYNLNFEFTVNCSPGVYFVRVNSSQGVLVKKIVIQ